MPQNSALPKGFVPDEDQKLPEGFVPDSAPDAIAGRGNAEAKAAGVQNPGVSAPPMAGPMRAAGAQYIASKDPQERYLLEHGNEQTGDPNLPTQRDRFQKGASLAFPGALLGVEATAPIATIAEKGALGYIAPVAKGLAKSAAGSELGGYLGGKINQTGKQIGQVLGGLAAPFASLPDEVMGPLLNKWAGQGIGDYFFPKSPYEIMGNSAQYRSMSRDAMKPQEPLGPADAALVRNAGLRANRPNPPAWTAIPGFVEEAPIPALQEPTQPPWADRIAANKARSATVPDRTPAWKSAIPGGGVVETSPQTQPPPMPSEPPWAGRVAANKSRTTALGVIGGQAMTIPPEESALTGNGDDLISRTRALVKPGVQPTASDMKRAGDLTQAPLGRLQQLAKFGDKLAENEINRRLKNP